MTDTFTIPEIPVNATSIETCRWHIFRELFKRYGIAAAEREIAPLNWYIDTGRASVPFLRALINSKPFMIARRLHAGGSDEEVLDRIKTYIGIE